MLTCYHFPRKRRAQREKPVLGLNITAPEELRLHSDYNQRTSHAVLDWWRDLVALAVEAGYEVRMFTNGSLQDEMFLSRLIHRIKPMQVPETCVSFEPRPQTPDVLAAIIAECDVLAGHRLHAHIPAFSYGIPSVGFAWDEKLRSFFESVHRSEFVMDAGGSAPHEVLRCIVEAHSAGVDQETWRGATRKAQDAVAEMVRILEEAVMGARRPVGSVYA
jgi:polysaccharide pyruvyl transferase WcaK-like protein